MRPQTPPACDVPDPLTLDEFSLDGMIRCVGAMIRLTIVTAHPYNPNIDERIEALKQVKGWFEDKPQPWARILEFWSKPLGKERDRL